MLKNGCQWVDVEVADDEQKESLEKMAMISMRVMILQFSESLLRKMMTTLASSFGDLVAVVVRSDSSIVSLARTATCGRALQVGSKPGSACVEDHGSNHGSPNQKDPLECDVLGVDDTLRDRIDRCDGHQVHSTCMCRIDNTPSSHCPMKCNNLLHHRDREVARHSDYCKMMKSCWMMTSV
jgi:hypothetical protein